MSDINRVNGLLRALPVEYLAPKSSAKLRAGGNIALADPIPDDVVLSEIGTELSRLAQIPGVRVGKIAKIRAAIAAGTYESSHKIDAVVDRLLSDLTR